MTQRQDSYKNKPPMKLVKAKEGNEGFIMDGKGFFLIDPRPEEGLIYAHHYHNDKRYDRSIAGKTAQDVYHALLKEGLVGSLTHAAYLGSELQKAEILIRYNIDMYTQDRPLILPLDIKKHIKKDNKACNHEKN